MFISAPADRTGKGALCWRNLAPQLSPPFKDLRTATSRPTLMRRFAATVEDLVGMLMNERWREKRSKQFPGR